ncbi:MAG: NAD(P)/FAD-dependent oxidoreductase [Lachnospiraceae bacterium]|nr:NAD(P)/FAD-dependent oxidoreductase [Lachnospiraceae bacterium]
MNKIIVIGGGPAGMLAAVSASKENIKVILLEKNDRLGKKLFITGKGRCNITNSAGKDVIMKNIMTNPKFMFSALDAFDNNDICRILEEHGCKVKEERGGRIFPVTDHSSDVIKALIKMLDEKNVEVRLNSEVKSVEKKEEGFEVALNDKESLECDAVILTTGGVSYPGTGSTGDGYVFAQKLGHSVKECTPSLVPLETKQLWCRDLQGLSLKNTGLKMYSGGKLIYEDFGEMLFTHFGISGPMVLSASSYYHKRKSDECRVVLDLKPALSGVELDDRLLREISDNHEKHFINMLPSLLPAKMVPVIASLSGIDPHKKCGDIIKEERKNLVRILKNLEIDITGTRGFDEAIITKGGISVKEVSPGNMMSKIVPGLFIAGEILDLDALTGGFNLQIAWSTGYLAGIGASEYLEGSKGEII